MEFKIARTLTLKDYFQYNMHHAGKRILIPNIIIVLILPWIYVMGTDTPTAHYWFVLPLAYCAAIAISGLMFMLSLSLIKRNLKKVYNSSKPMQSESTLLVDDTQISETSSFGNFTFGWADIYKASESKNGIYIYGSKLQAVVIPKRLLSQQEESTLRTIIAASLNATKNKLKK